MAGAKHDPPRTFDETWDQPKGFVGMLATIDNIPIAVRYMATAFAYFLIGGALAALMRMQLARPENTLVDAATLSPMSQKSMFSPGLYCLRFSGTYANQPPTGARPKRKLE